MFSGHVAFSFCSFETASTLLQVQVLLSASLGRLVVLINVGT